MKKSIMMVALIAMLALTLTGCGLTPPWSNSSSGGNNSSNDANGGGDTSLGDNNVSSSNDVSIPDEMSDWPYFVPHSPENASIERGTSATISEVVDNNGSMRRLSVFDLGDATNEAGELLGLPEGIRTFFGEYRIFSASPEAIYGEFHNQPGQRNFLSIASTIFVADDFGSDEQVRRYSATESFTLSANGASATIHSFNVDEDFDEIQAFARYEEEVVRNAERLVSALVLASINVDWLGASNDDGVILAPQRDWVDSNVILPEEVTEMTDEEYEGLLREMRTTALANVTEGGILIVPGKIRLPDIAGIDIVGVYELTLDDDGVSVFYTVYSISEELEFSSSANTLRYIEVAEEDNT